jgi:hypothetical protein
MNVLIKLNFQARIGVRSGEVMVIPTAGAPLRMTTANGGQKILVANGISGIKGASFDSFCSFRSL